MVSALLIVAVIVTALAGIAAAAYMFTDAGKDIAEWAAERFFKAKARAEEKALEKAGSDEMQGFLKGEFIFFLFLFHFLFLSVLLLLPCGVSGSRVVTWWTVWEEGEEAAEEWGWRIEGESEYG